MISPSDRQQAVTLIDEAHRTGARLSRTCAELGLTVRPYQRWTQEATVKVDGRPGAVRPGAANKLSAAEQAAGLAVCHEPQYASLPPGQIVPRLAAEGTYLASEATFYRILRQADEQHQRGRAQAPRPPSAPPRLVARAPNDVWTWDISWLPGPVQGLFFYLYLILDLYSRKIGGWEGYECESAAYAAAVVRRAVLAEGGIDHPLVLHADNGSPMKGETRWATLSRLGIATSYSRPRTSNDNPYSEALFRTCTYGPAYPAEGFASLEAARAWLPGFVADYNTVHRHSGVRFVTPPQRHNQQDQAILAQRQAVYEQARARHPERWSGALRNWQPISEVWLNPSAEVVDSTPGKPQAN